MTMTSKMTEFRCTIHNVKFAAESMPDRAAGCPYCQQDKMAKLREELSEAKNQRNALLRAIDIKQLHEEVK
jgi:hypothetical protein